MVSHLDKSILGVFGGTFDPIHFGHITPLLEATQELNLKEIKLIPCHIPPHKASPKVSSHRRLEMVRLLCEKFPTFNADSRELNHDKPSYSYDTLQSLRQEFPLRPLVFFMGMDSYVTLDQWYRWRELFGLCHIVVCKRPGKYPALSNQLRSALTDRVVNNPAVLHRCIAGKVYFAHTTEMAISSTLLKQRLSSGLNCSDLLPDVIKDYIELHALYR